MNTQLFAQGFLHRGLRRAARRSFWMSWTIGFAVCLSAALIGVETWQMWHVRDATLQNAAMSTVGIAESISLQVNNTFKTADTVVASIAQRVEAEGVGPDAQERLYGLMTSLAQALPAIHEMGITDAEGTPIVKSLVRHPVGLNYRERDYFQFLAMHKTGQVFIGAPVQSKIDGSLNITVSRRINHPDGSFAGVVVSSVSMDFFRRMFERVNGTSGALIALVSDDGTVLARSDPSFGEFEHQSQSSVSAGSPEYKSAKEQVDRVGASSHLAEYPMRVVTAKNTADVLVEWRNQVRNHGAVVICILAAIALLGYRVDQANRATHMQSLRDPLTGLANRRCLNETIDYELRCAARSGAPVSYIMVDIDLFKDFNDANGHPAGDACLQAVSTTIQGVLKRPADIAARYGGEEIAVLLPGTDQDGALRVAEQVRTAVAQLAIPHGKSPYGIVTVSAGVACCMPSASADAHQLVRSADLALYQAKFNGRNRCAAHTGDAMA